MAVFATDTLTHGVTGAVIESAVMYGNYYMYTIAADSNNALDSKRHHVAVTYDANANSHLLYLDGIPAPEETYDPNIGYIENDTVRIGASLNGNFPDANAASNFDGDIDSVRIYDRVLLADEVCYMANEATGRDLINYYCYHPLRSPANIVDDLQDYDLNERRSKQVNYLDYKALVENWLMEILWPE